MIYKKYEFSQSLYPNGKVLHIARSPSGYVAFRETTIEKLKKAIDTFEKEQKEAQVLAAKAKAKAAKLKKNKGASAIITNETAETESQNKPTTSTTETETESPTTPGIETTAKGQTTSSEENSNKIPSSKKGSFWDRLK